MQGAEIDREAVGGIRFTRFERGLVFTETVDQWRPNELLSFKIQINPKDIRPEALNWVIAGSGQFLRLKSNSPALPKHDLMPTIC